MQPAGNAFGARALLPANLDALAYLKPIGRISSGAGVVTQPGAAVKATVNQAQAG